MTKPARIIVPRNSAPPAETPVLRLQAYEGFKRQLLDANLRPGEFVSQRKLSELIGLPLGAIREAIPRLEAEGLIKTVPQRGLQIANVDLKLIRNAFQFRLLLEREAAVHFATTVADAELAVIEEAHLRIVKRARKAKIDSALLTDAQ